MNQVVNRPMKGLLVQSIGRNHLTAVIAAISRIRISVGSRVQQEV